MKTSACLLFVSGLLAAVPLLAAPLDVLIIDGQNNHDWKATTPVLKKILEDSGLFRVEVATTPPAGGEMSHFQPDFAAYRVLVSNYNGESWPRETKESFVRYVRGGGGLVVVHAADNSFADWPEYNESIGLGGWNGRNEKAGPYVRYVEGKLGRDTSP